MMPAAPSPMIADHTTGQSAELTVSFTRVTRWGFGAASCPQKMTILEGECSPNLPWKRRPRKSCHSQNADLTVSAWENHGRHCSAAPAAWLQRIRGAGVYGAAPAQPAQ